ncbi:microfibrillar-associated protein 1 [Plakobranchus ocellatus]|uniref:Microfibrillar-associated protein 1 n=1 Tax=Plakobranchus ocellatus TaxID=259542 RepID=A0AAV4C9P4_9GAST|nr:microfibrillar-associated protein 1 [Plakobranchus ocellatus]
MYAQRRYVRHIGLMIARHRREVIEPEVIAEGSDEDEDDRPVRRRRADEDGEMEDEEEEEEELDEEEIEKRRALRKQKAVQQKNEEEVMEVEEEKKEEEESEEESSEYEEYTDSEEETGPRLKPVFVRKKDRITVQEREREEVKAKDLELEAKRLAEERKRMTIKMANQDMQRELEEEKNLQEACDGLDSDDENDEEEYELWKIRELKRIKRDREEREALDKEKLEVDRLRNMTEEERRQELRQNPKQVTNKAPKGKYKFLQKYYHRGAFFLNEEDNVYKQDFSQPTLEDHFDKTILPKVMQVKNFGRSGRTKYTHLLDQDTTQHESPWIQDTTQNLKFHTARGGGMKQQFDRPSSKVKK